ncbi:hypothetical protein J1N35_000637 [Gossypium stocksii]|uniref:Uncharacterized protein n=1 Tax=Gossypium stocksii TaxID=47602 RepID=A0A9D4AL90_9ROSI|nr:hypothetical protein J1N35_000637 [Gossypium stocksii]
MLNHQSCNLKVGHQSEEVRLSDCQVATLEDPNHDIEAPKQTLKPTNEGVTIPRLGVATLKLDGNFVSSLLLEPCR